MLESKNEELKAHNRKLETTIMGGSKASVIADQNKELRVKAKSAQEELARYEELYNQQAYEIKKKDERIQLLNNALVHYSFKYILRITNASK